MPLIKGRLDNRRAIIDVGLQPTTILLDSVSPVALPPVIDISPLRGLIDTGAGITCITRQTAQRVGLRPKGKKRLGNVSNIEIHTSYSFVLGVWYSAENGEAMNTTRGYYGFEPILGADFKDNEDFDVLIGMDIMKAELKRRNVSYGELVERLKAVGVVDSEPNIRNKISRGKFTAVFFLQCLEAIGASSLRLQD